MRHCLSCCVSLPSAPNLEARSEGFRAPDVLVLLVLEPEAVVLSVENLITLLKDVQSVNIQLCLNICTVVSVSKH